MWYSSSFLFFLVFVAVIVFVKHFQNMCAILNTLCIRICICLLKTECENVIRKSAFTRLHSIDNKNKQSELYMLCGWIQFSRSTNQRYALTYYLQRTITKKQRKKIQQQPTTMNRTLLTSYKWPDTYVFTFSILC